MKISKAIADAIIKDGKQRHPLEACGVVLKTPGGETRAIATANEAGDVFGEQMFILDTATLENLKNQGEIIAIYHTHPHTPADPSLEDLIGCRKSGVNWLVCNPHSETFKLIDHTKITAEVPLLGRSFSWGVFDCYALVKDFYKQELNIELPEFDRGLYGQWNKGETWDKFNENFEKAGFYELAPRTPLQRGDVFLMNIMSDKVNHCGVLVDADKNVFWHHLVDRLSESAVYGGWFSQVTRKIIRYHAQ